MMAVPVNEDNTFFAPSFIVSYSHCCGIMQDHVIKPLRFCHPSTVLITSMRFNFYGLPGLTDNAVYDIMLRE